MSSDTTTNELATTAAGLPDRRQRDEWFPHRDPAEWNVTVGQDPERARKLGHDIQTASRRLEAGQLAAAAALAEDRARRANVRAGREYVRGLNRARVLLRQAAALKPGDSVGEFADHLAYQIGQEIRRSVGGAVPERSDIRPEVPGDRQEANGG